MGEAKRKIGGTGEIGTGVGVGARRGGTGGRDERGVLRKMKGRGRGQRETSLMMTGVQGGGQGTDGVAEIRRIGVQSDIAVVREKDIVHIDIPEETILENNSIRVTVSHERDAVHIEGTGTKDDRVEMTRIWNLDVEIAENRGVREGWSLLLTKTAHFVVVVIIIIITP